MALAMQGTGYRKVKLPGLVDAPGFTLTKEFIMGKAIDETGNVYGKLTVVRRGTNDRSQKAHWWCRCKCGEEVLVRGDTLRRGISKSCGCYQRETSRKDNTPVSIADCKCYPEFPFIWVTAGGELIRKTRAGNFPMSHNKNNKNKTSRRVNIHFKGKLTKRLVHRIVASTWIGEIPKGWHVHHIDGDPTNNHPENLAIVHPIDHKQIHMDIEKGVDRWLALSNIKAARTVGAATLSRSTMTIQASAFPAKQPPPVKPEKNQSGQKKIVQTQLGLFSKEAFRL